MAVVVNEVMGYQSPVGHPHSPAARADWRQLRRLVMAQVPALSAPAAGRPGLCAVCRGPASPSYGHCFQCRLHAECASGALADLVLPVAYAIKGSQHARYLWQYKSPAPVSRGGPPADDQVSQGAVSPDLIGTAAASLLALLLVFLHDHGRCLWRAIGVDGPSHVAVVPGTRQRGTHPLRALIAPYLARPWVELSVRPDDHRLRELDPGRFAAQPVPGARVLLVDDTWTTGASAQSAAMALRRAGARSVATVVIGRHISLSPAACRAFGPAAMPFTMGTCAVHRGSAVTG